MRLILDYASQQASGIAAWERDTEHIEKSLVFAGHPARNGVTAALLIQIGGTGVEDIFAGTDNFLLAFQPKADPNGLIDKLGERYAVTRTNIKKWTVGSPIQAPLDAIENHAQEASFRGGAGREDPRARGVERGEHGKQSRHAGHLPAAHGGRHAAG